MPIVFLMAKRCAKFIEALVQDIASSIRTRDMYKRFGKLRIGFGIRRFKLSDLFFAL